MMRHRIKQNRNCFHTQLTERREICLTNKISLLVRKQSPVKQKQALLGSNLSGIAGTNKGVSKNEHNLVVVLTPVWGMHKKIPTHYPLRTLLNLQKVNYLSTINQLKNQYECPIYAYSCRQYLMTGLIINYYEPNI
jgi:hypothetical protein